MKIKKAAIIGCGNIGGFLDTPEDNHIVTHAHAYAKHSGTQLSAVCDTDESRLAEFKKRWGESITSYTEIDELIKKEEFEIASICSPTFTHAKILKKLMKKEGLETIICEKPFVENIEELTAIEEIIKRRKKRVMINFLRRFDPGFAKVENFIKDNRFGNLIEFNGIFTKGIYHNGSHVLEMIERFFGNIIKLEAISKKEADGDFLGTFLIKTKNAQGIISNFSGKNYAMFEFDTLFEKGRVKILNAGHKIEIYELKESKTYKNYYNLELTDTLHDTFSANMMHSLEFALDGKQNKQILKEHIDLSRKLIEIKNSLKNKNTLEWK